MRKTLLEKGQARFGVRVNSSCRKLFYYFRQKDYSLGVGSYDDSNSTAEVRLDKEDEWEAHISELKKIAKKSFVKQKTSFHKSGYIVQKDKKGGRFSDEKDVASIPFSEVKDPVQLKVIYPTSLDRYLECKVGHKINIETMANEAVPIMIKLFLAPVSFKFSEWALGIDSKSSIYVDEESLFEIGLNVYTVFRESNNAFVPDAHVEADTIF